MNYYPHHIGDFNNATRHLSRVERSVYRDLIELYYDTEKPLSLDLKALSRKVLARSDEESTAVEQVLNEFFTKTDGGWYHDRCEQEISDYYANISAKSAAGKASAAKREADRNARLAELNGDSTKVEQNSNSRSTAVQQPLDSVDSSVQLTKNQEPGTINQEPLNSNTKPAAAKDAEPKEFVEAWQAYPKRPGASRKDALKAWKARIASGVDPETICSGVKRYAAYVVAKQTEPEYIKQPATFFGPADYFVADWTVHAARASPGYQTANDKAKSLADRLTGRARNEQPDTIIDIN